MGMQNSQLIIQVVGDVYLGEGAVTLGHGVKSSLMGLQNNDFFGDVKEILDRGDIVLAIWKPCFRIMV